MESNNLVRNIHIGRLIKEVVTKQNIDNSLLIKKMDCSGETLLFYYNSKTLDAGLLLKFSKILRYDFFRLYSSHLMLHHGISNTLANKKTENIVEGVRIRKNVYTKELISYLLDKIRNNEMTKVEVISKYGVPKTTLYKWMQKYPKPQNK